jgi:uncharacterized membrane protein
MCLLVILAVSGANTHLASASVTPVQYVQSTSIVLSSDGEAAVNQTLVMPQNITSIVVPLLSNQVGDILAVDQSGSPESYQVGNGNITIYTLGDSLVSLTYYTNALTTKQGSVWTVDFTWNANSTLELPYQSTILSLSGVPISVSEHSESPVMVLGPGLWQISYGLPIATSLTQTSSSTRTSSTVSMASSVISSGAASGSSTSSAESFTSSTGIYYQGNAPESSPFSYALVGIVAAAVILVTAAGVLLRRRSRSGLASPEALRPDDLEMLRFIRDKGGKVVEAEIRERFDVPRTTAWRQAKRLEQLGYLRVKKLGSQNQLELIRNDFS